MVAAREGEAVNIFAACLLKRAAGKRRGGRKQREKNSSGPSRERASEGGCGMEGEGTPVEVVVSEGRPPKKRTKKGESEEAAL